jgi:hypothetical protein
MKKCDKLFQLTSDGTLYRIDNGMDYFCSNE